MRELKFRIWDTLAKKYISQRHYLSSMKVDDSGIATFTYKQYLDGGFIIHQFTGLKDKNGKEIYEGDIVIYRNKNREIRIDQYFNGEDERSGCFIQDPIVKHGNFGTSRISDFEKCEVIGNIFENPELLEA